MKTSIKVKKLWLSDLAGDGGAGINWIEYQLGSREATLQMNGSDADTTNYKNVIGGTLESAKVKGDITVNFQLADLTPEVIAELIGGTVTDDAEATTVTAPENQNQNIEKSVRILTEKNVVLTVPRASLDAYPIVNDDDLHYFQVNSVALTPEKAGVTMYSMSVLKAATLTDTDIKTFVLAEQDSAAVIDTGLHTVAIDVVTGTDPSTLTPEITVALGASIEPASGTEEDFTTPVTYTVESADGTEQAWVVTVTVV